MREEVSEVEVRTDDALLLGSVPINGDCRTHSFLPLTIDRDKVGLCDGYLSGLLFPYDKVLLDELVQFLLILDKIKREVLFLDNALYTLGNERKLFGRVVRGCDAPIEVIHPENIVELVEGYKVDARSIKGSKVGWRRLLGM